MGAQHQFSAFIPGFKARLDKVTGIRETRLESSFGGINVWESLAEEERDGMIKEVY